eukprot:TRINITY_DN21102_c0_g1_i4.p1 TRINITY_DN21102_c0_g1~~TRINITY_DN21102_c0_g1_i4.p1  ORF type:complete len:491 (+),score=150.77 TRINITY_DN21102_c0_g1_i4:104-1576(+)
MANGNGDHDMQALLGKPIEEVECVPLTLIEDDNEVEHIELSVAGDSQCDTASPQPPPEGVLGSADDEALAAQPAASSSQAGGTAEAEAESSAAPQRTSRTEDQKAVLRAKLVKFYTKYNPDMLEGDHLEKVVCSSLPDQAIFKRLYERYIKDQEDEEDADAHPKLVGERRRQVEKRVRIPRGGHSVAGRFSDHTMALIIPVSITMFVVGWAVTNFTPLSEVSQAQPIYLAYHENSTDSSGEKLGGALLNGIIIVCFFGVVTTIMAVLYKMRCMGVIKGWLILSSASILYFMGFIWFDMFFTKYQIPYDAITCIVVMFNFGTVGVWCIYYRGHPKVTQAYLVVTAAIMAWFLSRLPEWTTWVLLGLVAAYDIFAVLTPKGPLKVLVEESQKRNEPIPGLIYESKQFKLGLGDFVFYSVLVGRAAVFNYVTWAVSFLAVLTGLCATLSCLGYMEKPLPALPISIALGIAFHFLARFLLLPYLAEFYLDGIRI